MTQNGRNMAKLQLRSETDYFNLIANLGTHSSKVLRSYNQQDFVLDGPNNELYSDGLTLMIRHETDNAEENHLGMKDQFVHIVLKQHMLSHQVTDPNLPVFEIAERYEKHILSTEMRKILVDTPISLNVQSNIFQEILLKYPQVSIKCIGSFKNNREVFDWGGINIEVDRCTFSFGDGFFCRFMWNDELVSRFCAYLDSKGIVSAFNFSSKASLFYNGLMQSALTHAVATQPPPVTTEIFQLQSDLPPMYIQQTTDLLNSLQSVSPMPQATQNNNIITPILSISSTTNDMESIPIVDHFELQQIHPTTTFSQSISPLHPSVLVNVPANLTMNLTDTLSPMNNPVLISPINQAALGTALSPLSIPVNPNTNPVNMTIPHTEAVNLRRPSFDIQTISLQQQQSSSLGSLNGSLSMSPVLNGVANGNQPVYITVSTPMLTSDDADGSPMYSTEMIQEQRRKNREASARYRRKKNMEIEHHKQELKKYQERIEHLEAENKALKIQLSLCREQHFLGDLNLMNTHRRQSHRTDSSGPSEPSSSGTAEYGRRRSGDSNDGYGRKFV
ncbi:hypothetical protein HK098_002797 [Nowakowskiella sp. JEL0407]|nr:hypothetical protein HK098_002797 [Nowakowskiella sp. JEL0407]